MPAYACFVSLMRRTDLTVSSVVDLALLSNIVQDTLSTIHHTQAEEEDEEEQVQVDLEFIKCVEEVIVPACMRKKDDVGEGVFGKLEQTSRFLHAVPGGVDYLSSVQARAKPAVSQAALNALIHTAHIYPAALHALIRRTQAIMQSYLKARRIYGGRVNILPPICAEEVLHALNLLMSRKQDEEEQKVWMEVGWCVAEELVDLVALGDAKLALPAQKVVKQLMASQRPASYIENSEPCDYFQ